MCLWKDLLLPPPDVGWHGLNNGDLCGMLDISILQTQHSIGGHTSDIAPPFSLAQLKSSSSPESGADGRQKSVYRIADNQKKYAV